MLTFPTRMTALLQGWNDEISAALGSTISLVEPILIRNEAPFFADYTGHGMQHVQNVLNTCELLISEEAWNEFTRQDAALLILATLAHDLGMLINLDGFRALVNPDQHEPLIEPQDVPWEKGWREFQLEVRRFDGTTLMNLLGSPEPVDMEELHPANLSEHGMKIAGEFLRRNHHRLAHEIVRLGMPSENGRVDLFGGVPEYLRDIAGIVGRSHGVPIRDCLDCLVRMDRTAHRAYRGLHPTFLICVIRLADYLDLDIGRAPGSVLSAKSLKSPVSRREWWSHRAVLDSHSFGEDPECLRIVVEASALIDIGTYIVTEEKIRGTQEELDACWAVLGEVYGRFPPLNRLGLRLRRIRSDLRESAIIGRLPFVPYKAELESARADLLKLLIEPLYGDSPSIGIRELVQNAVDAVRELEFILNRKPSFSAVEREQLDGDIAVYFERNEHGDWWVTVADSGIGMTWKTVRKYYLTAGASFRKSDAWKKEFTGDSGKSQVLRSGRFGIGVLAAFLLGDRIKVSTRHIEEPENRGIQFEFGFDDGNIEMRWTTRKVGTTVSVRISESTLSRLHPSSVYYSFRAPDSWDWYSLEKPILIRHDKDGKIIKPKYKLPGAEGPLPANLHRIQAPGFQAIDWTYDPKFPNTVCNGILIPHAVIAIEHEFEPDYPFYYSHLILRDPKVSIFDPDGRLPLNLARNSLARKPVGFESLLVDDICRNFLAFCLMRGPQHRCISREPLSVILAHEFAGSYASMFSAYLFDSCDGFGLTDPWNISYFLPGRALLIRCSSYSLSHTALSESTIYDIINEYSIIIPVQSDDTLGSFDHWHRRLILHSGGERLPIFKYLNVSGIRTIMSNTRYSRLVYKQPQFVVKSTSLESATAEWKLWTVGTCPTDSQLVVLADAFKANDISFESLTEVHFSPSDERPAPGRIARMWKDAIGNPVIPHDPASRQSIIARLDTQFQRHLAQWAPKERSKQKL
ncbi:MAG: ATP-binding protein [Syntrophobacteraceae bacterium]